MKPKALASWSSGKDAAWALHLLRGRSEFEVVGLLTAFEAASGRVAVHRVRREVVETQAAAVGLPLWPVNLPWPCPNAEYEARLRAAVGRARATGVTHVAFGDLHLADIRAYRERLLAGTGVEPVFPAWCAPADTPALARAMTAAGVRAVLACVDPARLAPAFAGRAFDAGLLADLPNGVDPCGENGEFHTVCTDGPPFACPVPVRVGEVAERSGFGYADVLLTAGDGPTPGAPPTRC